MSCLDWAILATYILLVISMSWWVGRRQESQEDYYLAGRRMGAWPIALSVMANQVSAISLIGAPAFIALRQGGGLTWLQYEFAIPIAMIAICFILIPVYHKTGGTTIYEYLERRFGKATRSGISAIFLISRGLGAGVALLAAAIVITACLGLPLWQTVLLIGAVSVLYTTIGGIVADIYSDILQLVILWLGSVAMVFVLIHLLDADSLGLVFARPERLRVFDLGSSGLGDGQTFSFWAMLCGGLFLYVSYYGCDQSQAQRLLTTADARRAQKAMVLNGILRFFLVLTYCAVGVLLIPFLLSRPEFNARLTGLRPDFLVPLFMVEYVPAGLLGMVVSGFFAASMSSIDSALNSLSAATYRDFLAQAFPGLNGLSEKRKIRLSRALTLFWGVVASGFALLMIGGPETVLELVNRIGSAFYGPVLAVFILGMTTSRIAQGGALFGLIVGVAINVYLWVFHSDTVSWLWWNVFGFAGCVAGAYSWGRRPPSETSLPRREERLSLTAGVFTEMKRSPFFYILAAAFLAFLGAGYCIERFFLHR